MSDISTPSPAVTKQAQPETVALFISDLHLTETMPRTTERFFAFLQEHALHVRELYLLGDMFEYWVGDDDIGSPYNRLVTAEIRRISGAGVRIFWLGGNRDFLAGSGFASASGVTLLPDPYVTDIAGQRIVLTHGDAHCTDDLSYMAFRAQVRDPQWQQMFLAQPLEQRKKIVESMRMESRHAQREKSMEIMDVNPDAIAALFEASGTEIMVHGHTHRPARHEVREGDQTRIRYVLPDWDCDHEPRRGGWLAIDADGAIRRHDIDGRELD